MYTQLNSQNVVNKNRMIDKGQKMYRHFFVFSIKMLTSKRYQLVEQNWILSTMHKSIILLNGNEIHNSHMKWIVQKAVNWLFGGFSISSPRAFFEIVPNKSKKKRRELAPNIPFWGRFTIIINLINRNLLFACDSFIQIVQIWDIEISIALQKWHSEQIWTAYVR